MYALKLNGTIYSSSKMLKTFFVFMTFSKDTKVPHEGEKYKRKEVVDTLVQVVVSIHGKKNLMTRFFFYFKKLLSCVLEFAEIAIFYIL